MTRTHLKVAAFSQHVVLLNVLQLELVPLAVGVRVGATGEGAIVGIDVLVPVSVTKKWQVISGLHFII